MSARKEKAALRSFFVDQVRGNGDEKAFGHSHRHDSLSDCRALGSGIVSYRGTGAGRRSGLRTRVRQQGTGTPCGLVPKRLLFLSKGEHLIKKRRVLRTLGKKPNATDEDDAGVNSSSCLREVQS